MGSEWGGLQMQGRRLCACRGQRRWTACRDGGICPAGRQDVRGIHRRQCVRPGAGYGAGSWLSDWDAEGYWGLRGGIPWEGRKLAGGCRCRGAAVGRQREPAAELSVVLTAGRDLRL